MRIGYSIKWHQPLSVILLLGLGVLAASQAQAQLRVLAVHSYESHLPWVEGFTNGVLDWPQQDVVLFNEYLDAERLSHQSQDSFVEYLLERYEGQGIDFILLNSSAASLLVKDHEEVFNRISEIRVHYSMLDIPLAETEALISPDFGASVQQTMQVAHTLQPELTNVLIIEGPTFVDREIDDSIRQVFEGSSVQVEVMRRFTLEEMESAVLSLPSSSAIFMSLVFSDTKGNQYVPKQVARRVVELSSAPVYTLYSSFMETGAIGGYLFDSELVAQTMMNAGIDLLEDARLSREYRAEVPMFDASAMKSFRLDPSRLPAGALMLNEPKSLVEKYPKLFELLFVALATALVLFIAWLLYQRWYNLQLKQKNILLNRLKSELTIANERLQELALYDSLTGLLNRQAAEPMLQEAISRLRRYHTPAVLLIVDIDDFKQVNDKFGHDVGDKAIVGVSNALVKGVRDSDMVARWGGEEFVVLLSNTELEGAAAVAKSLCRTIEQALVEPRITISIGGAPLKNGETWEHAFKQADEALYQVKSTGKNNVKFASTKSFSMG